MTGSDPYPDGPECRSTLCLTDTQANLSSKASAYMCCEKAGGVQLYGQQIHFSVRLSF